MRKLSFSLMTMLLGMVVLFSACGKEESASPVTINSFKKGTLKGYVQAEYDNTSSGYEKAAGVKVKITIDNDELTNDYNARGVWSTIVETDADGIFEVEVPATEEGVYVYYEVLGFEKSVEVSNNVYENRYFYYSKSSEYLTSDDLEVVEFSLYSYEVGNE